MKQREKMRQLFKRFHGSKDPIIEAYAEAESAHEVERKSNSRKISSHDYASRLFADGVKKRWIYQQ